MNESTRVCERRRLFAPPSHHHVVAAPDSPERWRYGNVSEEMARCWRLASSTSLALTLSAETRLCRLLRHRLVCGTYSSIMAHAVFKGADAVAQPLA